MAKLSFSHREDLAEVEGYPTVLVLHGTGGDEHSLVPFAQAVYPGAGILSVRGRILERGMPRFFRRFAEGVFDYENIREEAKALGEFLAGRTGLRSVGYSNGANMALATLLLEPGVWEEGVLFRPMVTLTPAGSGKESALETNPKLVGKRIFLSAGRFDPIVPYENVEELASQLRAYGAEVELHWVDGGHELTRSEIETARSWTAAL